MAKQTINIGASPNDGTGTPLRTSFDYCNQNFTELYTATGPSGNNIVVPGNATITGDLTVDTNTLKVVSASDTVGIRTTTPNDVLEVVGSGANGLRISRSGLPGQYTTFSAGATGQTIDAAAVIGVITFGIAGSNQMTLNSTGLGVGVVPSLYRFEVGSGSTDTRALFTSNNAFSIGVKNGANQLGGWIGSAGNNILTFSGNDGTMKVTIDNPGNVGVGVTPSAWRNTQRALQIGAVGTYFSSAASTGSTCIGRNVYENTAGDFTYIVNDEATFYEQTATGQHAWYTAAAGTGTIAFGSAKMTLDASGNLLVGTTSASGTRTYFKGSSTSTDYVTTLVNSSNKVAFGVRNDGLIITGSPTDVATLPNAPYNLTTGSAANLFIDSIGVLYRSTSSMKYKSDIADSTRGLADVLKLRPVTYKAKNSGDTVFGGLIAEEVAAAGLTEFVQYAPDNTPDAIHYGNMVSLLVAAIKELSAEVNALKNA